MEASALADALRANSSCCTRLKCVSEAWRRGGECALFGARGRGLPGAGRARAACHVRARPAAAARSLECSSISVLMVIKGEPLMPLRSSANEYCIRFRHVWWYWANLLDFVRLVLCVAATFTVLTPGLTSPWVSAFLLIVALVLDIYDGKLARRFKQCTIMGDGLDWTADLYIDLLLCMWWGRVEPTLAPFVMLWTMTEVMAALFDFAILSSDRYPRRAAEFERGFNIVLACTIPGGSWNRLGWAMWLAYPHFVLSRCLFLDPRTEGVELLSPLLLLIQAVLVVPSALFVWSNAALLVSNIDRWTEKPRPGQGPPKVQ